MLFCCSASTVVVGVSTGLLTQVDADLAGCEALQAVPRLVYGMLRCALMMQRPAQHPDERVALKHLWGNLPPREIRCALYPTLSSFSDLDTMVCCPCPRSWLAVSLRNFSTSPSSYVNRQSPRK